MTCIISKTSFAPCTSKVNAKTKMRHSKIMRDWNLTLLWERIIVHICRPLGNLKKTQIGDPQWPSATKVWSLGADVWSADVWMGGSNIGTFKHRHYSVGNSYGRCLNVPMCLNRQYSNIRSRSLNGHSCKLHMIICSPSLWTQKETEYRGTIDKGSWITNYSKENTLAV